MFHWFRTAALAVTLVLALTGVAQTAICLSEHSAAVCCDAGSAPDESDAGESDCCVFHAPAALVTFDAPARLAAPTPAKPWISTARSPGEGPIFEIEHPPQLS